jgi:NADPH:quinone reductase-like Zn-dependent oxidoreductase/NAD(P)-dependent dehydrogenase (short-subunit alcohol dehydrogenase family)/acyl carrier protein/SAM-dependent methyltransferase
LSAEGRLEIKSRVRLSDEPWSLNAVGRAAALDARASPPAFDQPPAQAIESDALYALARDLKLTYGPAFRTVTRVEIAGAEARAYLQSAEPARAGYLLSPALFDGALQGFLGLLSTHKPKHLREPMVPARFGRVRVFAPYGRKPAAAHLKLERAGERSASGAVALIDSEGKLVAEALGCVFRQAHLARAPDLDQRSFYFKAVAAPRAEARKSPPIDIAKALGAASQENALAREPDESAALFDAYFVAAAHESASALVGAAPFTLSALIAKSILAPEAVHHFSMLLRLLERHGLARESGEGWRLKPESGFPESRTIWRTLLDERPELVADLALSAGAASAQERFLRFGARAAADMPPALLDQFLFASPAGKRAIAALCHAVQALAESWPEGRPLRIIEIGAGSGALCRRLLAQLARRVASLVYVATDPDADAVARLAAVVSSRPGARACPWDPRESEDDRLPSSLFDIALSASSLTRLACDRDALAALHRRLADGGVLLAAEPEPNTLWAMIFGEAATSSNARRRAVHADALIQRADAWRALIEEAGFEGFASVPLAEAHWPARLIAARASRNAEEESVTAPTKRAVLIASADDPLARALARRLSDAGLMAELLDPPAVTDGNLLCAALAESGAQAPEVVLLPPTSPASDEPGATAAARMTTAATVVKLAQSVTTQARLWFVTRDAQQKAPAPEEAALWGLARTIANELPQFPCRLVDLPKSRDSEEAAACLADEILAPDNETEIVLTPSGRHALRLARGLPETAADDEALSLRVAQPGLLDSLRFSPASPRAPGPGEVAIEVKACGLNFRDVMWAMDLLPEEALSDGFAGATLGLECAGIVRAKGPGVEGLEAGARVFGFAPAALGSHAVTAAHAVLPIPEKLSFAAAATIPVTYLTAVYALGAIAKLQEGERVLIHGGAGGVGLAAIYYAQHCGAEIFATAGSEVKRAFLRALGVPHVLDSRSLSFADEVMALTKGEGVDVVLNSLYGEAMERSLGLLRPFGRFVELGKRDFYLNTRVGLRPLRNNVSYFALDADQLPARRPDRARAVLTDVLALMERGVLRPLPHQAFSFSDVQDAFRLMQASGHIGKIVLVPDEREPSALGAPRRFPIHPDRTYLVTGGLSGFGLATARYLCAEGVRHLALMSRRGAATPGAEEALQSLREAGADARAFACDVAERAALSAALRDIRATMPPLAGVVHAAMAIDDSLVTDLTGKRLAHVLAPKLSGALNLDRLTRQDPIELFILYSSATTLLGAPGQGSYVAANLALEALSRARMAKGLPSLAVAWGPIADTGYLAAKDAEREALARRLAAQPMPAREALECLPALWASGLPSVACVTVNWHGARQRLAVLSSPTFADIAGSMAKTDGTSLREHLQGLSADEARELVVALLREEIARILMLAPDRIDPSKALSELGMDSLMAVELRLALEAELGVEIPILSLADNTTLVALARRVVNALAGRLVDSDVMTAIVRHESGAPAPARIAQPEPPSARAIKR